MVAISVVRLHRVDANQDPTLAACCDRHVAADEKGESAEHLLLGQIGLAVDQFPDASLRAPRRRPRPRSYVKRAGELGL